MRQTDQNNNYFQDKSPQMMAALLSKLQQTHDRSQFQKEVHSLDQQLYTYYAAQNYATNQYSKQLYEQPIKEAIKLSIPARHSLADSMLRNTLGCDEKFAQRYIQITDMTKQEEDDSKKKRIEDAKKKFAAYNAHGDFGANTKPYMNRTKFAEQRPVIENQYDTYIKTHLTFLDKPRSNSKNKDYSSKHTQIIAKKIYELGGIQDTIGHLESSLASFELKDVKKKQVTNSFRNISRRVSPSPSRTSLRPQKSNEGLLDKSKLLRETIASKLF